MLFFRPVLLCIIAFIVPVGVVIGINHEKVFQQDLAKGRLLYFPQIT